MARKTLRVYLEKILLNCNGMQPPGIASPATEQAHNLIVATLKYPRSGAPTVASVKQVRLLNGVPVSYLPAANNFWDRLLFKEDVDDETELQIHVTNHTDPSKTAEWVKQLLGLGTKVLAAALATTGLLGVIVGSTVALVTGELEKDNGEGKVIGQTRSFQIKVVDTFSNPVAFGIMVPADVTIAYLEPVQQGSGEPTTKYVTLRKGDANGEIVLRLEFEP